MQGADRCRGCAFEAPEPDEEGGDAVRASHKPRCRCRLERVATCDKPSASECTEDAVAQPLQGRVRQSLRIDRFEWAELRGCRLHHHVDELLASGLTRHQVHRLCPRVGGTVDTNDRAAEAKVPIGRCFCLRRRQERLLAGAEAQATARVLGRCAVDLDGMRFTDAKRLLRVARAGDGHEANGLACCRPRSRRRTAL